MAIDRHEFTPLFAAIGAQLSHHQVDVLTSLLVERRLSRDEIIVSEGLVPDTLFFVAEGRLGVSLDVNGTAVEVGSVGPGSLCGEVSFVDSGPASATVTAVEPTRLLRMSHAAFDGLRRSQLRLATAVLRAMCRTLAVRVREATARLAVALEGQPGEVADEPPEPHARRFTDALRSLLGLHSKD